MADSPYLFDVSVRFQVYLERLKSGLFALYDPVLRVMEREVRTLIVNTGPAPLSTLTEAQFTRLTAALTKVMEDQTASYATTLTKELRKVARYAAEFEREAIIAAVKPEVRVAPLARSLTRAWEIAQTNPVQASGQTISEVVQAWRVDVQDTVLKAVRNGRAQGRTPQQVVRALRGTTARKNRDGELTGAQRKRTKSTVSTATQHAAASGKQATQEANPDIVKQYRWVSVLDNRTTAQCRSLDGQYFPVGKGPQPPIHFNCRSTTVSTLSPQAMAEKAAKLRKKGKEPTQVVTYYTWLKDQPAAFQDDVLGPVRGKLFRDGGLSAEDFARLNIGRDFEPLTLEEMRKLAPNAFARAGI